MWLCEETRDEVWRQQLAIPLGEGTDLASLDKLLTNVKTLLANQEATAVPATVTTSRPIEVVPPSFLKGVLAIATSAWRAKAKMVDATTGEVHREMARVYKDIERIYRHLEEIGFTIKNHTGDPYDDGQPMKVITSQPRQDATRKYVLETLLPTVYWNDRIIQHGEIEIAIPATSDHQPSTGAKT